MRTIYKYLIPGWNGRHQIQMPKNTRVLSVGAQPQHNGFITVWAEVHTQELDLLFEFRVVGTGEELRQDPGMFLGTVNQDPYWWHVYQVT